MITSFRVYHTGGNSYILFDSKSFSENSDTVIEKYAIIEKSKRKSRIFSTISRVLLRHKHARPVIFLPNNSDWPP